MKKIILTCGCGSTSFEQMTVEPEPILRKERIIFKCLQCGELAELKHGMIYKAGDVHYYYEEELKDEFKLEWEFNPW